MTLAATQPVSVTPAAVVSLHARLGDNAAVLLSAYRASAAEIESGRPVVPAAEWLLDNYHIVEAQIREVRGDLPPGYYRQLPKLDGGPFKGYPRVFGIAWAFVAHTDSQFDPDLLGRFISAYQRVQPLTIGELWAIAITLRIVLIENLRRLADQIMLGRHARAEADALANVLFASATAGPVPGPALGRLPGGVLSERLAAQLAKRLRGQDPRTTPVLGWLEERLRQQGATIDEVVERAQQRQGASNVTVRNIITSMRLMSDIDWAELFEAVSLVDARFRASSDFAEMDFPTRNLYRSAVEQLARGSPCSELEIADRAANAALAAERGDRGADPGYHLIGGGRLAFESAIDFRAPARLRITRVSIRLGIRGYAGAILLVSGSLLAAALYTLASPGLPASWLALLAVAGFIPATEIGTALVNRAVAGSFGATPLPGLELTSGVPASLRTLVAVPTLLTGEAELLAEVERLEVHYLAGAGGDLCFALLTDGVDAHQEVLDADTPLLALAAASIAELNHRHGPAAGGDRFLLLHRRRVFNAGEDRWMGWERKRGKLHELNRLLRGATDTSFIPAAGRPPVVPTDVRYVITLDADTRLPRDAALRLIGKMAHPLNRPRFDKTRQRVVDGYAILQPRVTPSLPVGLQGSLYQLAFSAPGGMDPYAATVSDVYQDLFGEGSYTGKGIYDVDAFEAALAGRVPENALLSHDLFEGIFARAGLASEVEVVEEFPSRYDVAARRQHRWTRGDWQLLPWILGRGSGARTLPSVGRWKMADNLRRSLLAPSIIGTLFLAWLLPTQSAAIASVLVLASILVPALLPLLFSILPQRPEVRLRNHLLALAADLRLACLQSLLSLTFLADHAWRMGDAIVRTLVRVFATRRHLLEWTTAAQSSGSPRLDLPGFYRRMAGGTSLGVIAAAGTTWASPSLLPVTLPFALLWLAAPAVALWASRPPRPRRASALSDADATELRLIARRTWRFFETFVTPLENMLPPDNFQEDPAPVIAHRTSPTNIGLYLLSTIAARDLGWTGTVAAVERLEAAFTSMQKMARFKGHFFNWYDTTDLRALDPGYVSSVDSGNLAGHLIATANACEEWIASPRPLDAKRGLIDTLSLARAAAVALGASRLTSTLEEFENALGTSETLEALAPALQLLAARAVDAAREAAGGDDVRQDAVFWTEALQRIAVEHDRDRQAQPLRERLHALAAIARETAWAMDFGFLLEPERKLLSIGYNVPGNALDPSCYDLLASEARLASLFAIAKGDVPTRHWFRLGRSATPLGRGSALISWSGSMFEYLMPSLVMRAPTGSQLEQTNRLIVERQQAYGRSLGIPWGVSESAYNARDLEMTYQYSNFGVPGLGLKRGLAENRVIAPYATGLAAMVDPAGALQNYTRLAAMGASGRFGFYEALDFTRSRLAANEDVAIVRSFMAHHQGMTVVAIANALQHGRMRDRFHREPIIQASELLLQERVPRSVAVSHPRAEEVRASSEAASTAPAVRRIEAAVGPPITHLLSNGRYSVMLTATGGGYSRWRDVAVTRWREDATRDDWGSRVFLRDVQTGKVWSAGAPLAHGEAEGGEVVFGEDHAEFIRHNATLTTRLDVLVSGECDAEVRRVSLTNSGRRTREVELTSYTELVLAVPSADDAHPAFAKMFVQTEHLPEFGALVATRRPRSREEPRVWAAHFAVVEGELLADAQYESDRARFLGRGSTAEEAMERGRALSGTVGTVLDPVFSLRRRVSIAPGQVARVAFWTAVAASREELLALIDKHHDRRAFDRAWTLAWTQAQVQLRHLAVEAAEAAEFQRLAAPILYADPRFRASSQAILLGAGPQSGLWPHAISGDVPIVLLQIDDLDDLRQLRQLLRAHEYWRMKRLAVDLVIVNERASSYVQDLQIAIETAVRSSQSRAPLDGVSARTSVFTLRADLMSVDARMLLRSAARVVLMARRGSIAEQFAGMPQAPAHATPALRRKPAPATSPLPPAPTDLEFFNGFGGFDHDGREYVTILTAGRTTPAPWVNVIANPDFGFQVSADGSGYTWAENSRENQLTPWSNDPVADPAGEAIYVRDERTGDVWTATAQPIRDAGRYVARHGHGFSRFEHEAHGVTLELLQYVPLQDPIKISRLTLRNRSGVRRRLSVTAYADWVLGKFRGAAAPFVTTEIDPGTGAMLARNAWSIPFGGRVAFADLGGEQTGWTGDRTEFLGRLGGLAAPAALMGQKPLSGAVGAGLDPCTALQRVVDLGPDESTEVVWFLGQCVSAEAARELVARYRGTDLDSMLEAVTTHWDAVLGTVQVETPDRAMDIMLNGWLLYQTIACRLWARSAFYQASGAYGFRDQLQDGMALSLVDPGTTRRHLLRAASRQFPEGDVQHWWLPHSGQGVRTRISDDRVWLAFAAATYIASSGDVAILDEQVTFLDGPVLRPGQHDAFFQPMEAAEPASMFEHCARGLDQAVALTGSHGLPLIGTGDWNDGMNLVGEGGKGESVWLAWLLLRTVEMFAPLASVRDPERALRWRAHAASVRAALEREAWDGAWYRRATFDDGTWLGSSESAACRIDSIAQSWAVLSGAADPVRAATAMASLDRHLLRPDERLALLFWPPFDQTTLDPGYIRGYPPGLRENGGQYSHAAMWAILAFAKLGQGSKAASLFGMLNPINHASTQADAERYKVEPFVAAADIYSVAPHIGRGGWTWYTGSAGLMYRAGIEGILGIRREGAWLVIDPCIPSSWPGFRATINVAGTRYRIRVDALPQGRPHAYDVMLDGVTVDAPPGPVRVALDGGAHTLDMSSRQEVELAEVAGG